ncbi:hypothetical protein E1B28_006275 [Marasmius oreades]|uniref:MFS general substrate transporter n=1 Tax=Marasmius oreades TaxID=181124 RepID=A0A9P7UV38_9AGAR|nr:uncharacterized protein E1B28_006275 [Marasmius oreades]KAG7095537.1 hypothetical protein E1B28_006275 [Marasmius oreades]
MTGGGFTVLDSGSSGGHFSGSSHIRGPTWLHLPILTLCLLGVQISWSVEMSNASPYLLSLGLSKSAMAIVFVAGPLSGLIVQPLIGVLADNNTSKWGRRRPYMMIGSVVCAGALLLLGWTKVVAGWFGQAESSVVIMLAVLSIYVIDFSINAVQAMDRALLVDTLPSVLQPAGNAWAAKMLAIGNVIGFFVGNLDLPLHLSFLGSTQLEVLSLIGSFVLLSTHLTTASMVREKVLLEKSQSGSAGPIRKFVQELKDIWIHMLTLPRVIRQICMIQFFAWLGWFPILFYTSVYIGDLNKRAFYATVSVIPPPGSSSSPITPEILASLDTESSRLGSRALFYSSLITLFMNFALPYFVTEASTNSRRRKQKRHQQTVANGFGSSHSPNGTFGGGMNETSNPTSETLNRGRNIFRKISAFAIPERMQLHLASLWAIGHAVFALCMLSTFFTSSVSGASILVAATGFSWAITQWVPFALLGEAILTEPSALADDRTSIQLVDTRHRRRSGSVILARTSSESRRELSMLSRSDIDSRGGTFTIEDQSDDDVDGDESKQTPQQMRSTLFGNAAAGVSKIDISGSRDDPQYPHDDDDDGEEAVLVGQVRDEEGDVGTSDDTDVTSGSGLSAKAGIILGIHNIFIVIPQFLVTGISSVIFALIDPSKSVLHGKHPGTSHRAVDTTEFTSVTTQLSRLLSIRNETSDQEAILEELVELEAAAKSNSVIYIFRIGGVAAFIAFILCWRLSRELRHR